MAPRIAKSVAIVFETFLAVSDAAIFAEATAAPFVAAVAMPPTPPVIAVSIAAAPT